MFRHPTMERFLSANHQGVVEGFMLYCQEDVTGSDLPVVSNGHVVGYAASPIPQIPQIPTSRLLCEAFRCHVWPDNRANFLLWHRPGRLLAVPTTACGYSGDGSRQP